MISRLLVISSNNLAKLSKMSRKRHKIKEIGSKKLLNVSFSSKLNQFTVVMDIADILIRIIDVSIDPFTLQEVGFYELKVRNRTSANIVEIVRFSY